MPEDNTEDRVTADVRAAARELGPGGRLPSVRALAGRHRASPVTVQRAITRLAAEGVVEPRPGRGTFVAAARASADPGRAAPGAPDLSWQELALGGRTVDAGGMDELLDLPAPGDIPLSTGYAEPALQPTAALAGILARAGRRPGAWDRLAVAGLPELRAWVARETGGNLREHDLVISPGGQAALGTVFRALGTPGDAVLVESPTYPGAVAAARGAGLRAVPVPADADGIRPDLLAEALGRTGARLAYCQPLHANPHGAVLASARRGPVLDAVAAAGAFLVEDDWARDLTIDGPEPPPLAVQDAHGHVVYLRSLTKSSAPGLRVAAVGARGAAGARLRAARVVDDFFVSGPLQHAALELVSSPAWRRHRRAVRAALAERRDALVDAVRQDLPEVELLGIPRGGLHLWLRLPGGTDDEAVARAARTAGVVVSPGRRWFPGEPPAPHLRLTFAGAPPAVLREGVRRLGGVL